MLRRILTLFIMTLMIVSLLPATVFADNPSVTLDEENSETSPAVEYEYDDYSQKYVFPEDGKCYQLFFDEHGESIDGNDHEVTAVSSNSAVIEIEKYGYLYVNYRVKKIGTATIKYTGNNGASIDVPITVTKAPYDVRLKAIIRNPEPEGSLEEWIEADEAIFDRFVDEEDKDCQVWIIGGRLDGKKLTFDGEALVDLEAEDNLFIDGSFIIRTRDTAGNTVLIAKDLDGKEVRLPIHISQNYLDARDEYFAQKRYGEYLKELADDCSPELFVDEDELELEIPFKEYNDDSEYPISQKDFSALKITMSIAGTNYKATMKTDPYSKGDYLAVFNFRKTFAWGTPYTIKYELKGKYATVNNVIKKDVSPKITIKNLTYNGKNRVPSVTVKYGTTVLKYGKDFDYYIDEDAAKKVGKYNITVYSVGKSKYSFYESKTFKINPKGTSIKSIKKGTNAFKVSWKKQATQTTGYQIQYGLKKTFKGAKTFTVKKNKTVKTTIKNLKSGKTYYVRIRTYKKIGKTKFYSSWSKTKKVTT